MLREINNAYHVEFHRKQVKATKEQNALYFEVISAIYCSENCLGFINLRFSVTVSNHKMGIMDLIRL